MGCTQLTRSCRHGAYPLFFILFYSFFLGKTRKLYPLSRERILLQVLA
jgi:hypothetical protein